MRSAYLLLPDKAATSEELSIHLEPFHLHGLVSDIYHDRRVVVRFGETRPRDLVGLFITHLIWILGTREDTPKISQLVCTDETWQIESLTDARLLLRVYLDLFWKGMHDPLPFFEQSSHVYAWHRLQKSATQAAAMAQALKKWQGDGQRDGELWYPYHALF